MAHDHVPWESFLDTIEPDQDFVILDVDRTLINTTSWYQACLVPHLLLHPADIPRFEALNAAAYGPNADLPLASFREQTLQLIAPSWSAPFLDLIKEGAPHWVGCGKEGTPTQSLSFFLAGLILAQRVHAYTEPPFLIKAAARYWGKSFRLLFLSSGYQPFIEGVVAGVLAQAQALDVKCEVLGSQVEFSRGRATETYQLSPFEKQKVVESILARGARIRFLADDSPENPGLFDSVRQAGGTAIQVEHRSGQKRSRSWRAVRLALHPALLKQHLMNQHPQVSLAAEDSIDTPFLKEFRQRSELGILRLDQAAFRQGLAEIQQHLPGNHCHRLLAKMVAVDANSVRLRGRLYYYWLPAYVHVDPRPTVQKWEELLLLSFEGLRLLAGANLYAKKSQLGFPAQALLFSFLDHFYSALLVCLNALEMSDIKTRSRDTNQDSLKLECLLQKVSDALQSFFLDMDSSSLVDAILHDIAPTKLRALFLCCRAYHRGMRELDDPVAIFRSVRVVAAQMKQRNTRYDTLISFPYGGMELGFALRSYLKNEGSPLPELIHCHYSSKKHLRDRSAKPDPTDEHWLEAYIPQKHRAHLRALKQGQRQVLLYDNNVTTFDTLDLCKIWLSQFDNHVDCVVTAVNYDNICQHVLGASKREPLSPHWQKTLNYPPVEAYVTAFDTWLTSAKSRFLEQLYLSSKPARLGPVTPFSKGHQDFHFKVCRVHNAFDLGLSLKHGASAIGIHAVSPATWVSLEEQLSAGAPEQPLAVDSTLPLAHFEVASIRHMLERIPPGVMRVLLFETPLSLEKMQACCEAYGLRQGPLTIQLQHRTHAAYIQQIKKHVAPAVIVTLGLFQEDFATAYLALQKSLDPETDFILIDLSKHQPDLIRSPGARIWAVDKNVLLRRHAPLLRQHPCPLLLADDVPPHTMRQYLNLLSTHGVAVDGIDIQNIVEIPKHEQRFRYFEGSNESYPAKIRKSADAFGDWDDLIRELRSRRPQRPASHSTCVAGAE